MELLILLGWGRGGVGMSTQTCTTLQPSHAWHNPPNIQGSSERASGSPQGGVLRDPGWLGQSRALGLGFTDRAASEQRALWLECPLRRQRPPPVLSAAPEVNPAGDAQGLLPWLSRNCSSPSAQ